MTSSTQQAQNASHEKIKARFPADILQKAKKVRLCIFDVDGVLTDGKIILGPGDVELKAFDVKDGQGIVMLRDFVEIGVITGRRSEVVTSRMSQLGVKHVFQGQKDKSAALGKLLLGLELDPDAVCYVGDDLPDLAVMQQVGLAVAVADASPVVLDAAHYCTTKAGGRGAAREVCELILTAQSKFDVLVCQAANAQVAVDQNL